MRRQFDIPDEVRRDVLAILSEGVENTLANWESAAEDEDALTGHLGAELSTPTRSVFVDGKEVAGNWRWSLRYVKFRRRGPNAAERFLGADGIFELSVDRAGHVETKSALFQSKFAGEGGRDLIEQCVRLSTWREAAFVIAYSEDEMTAMSIDAVL